MAVWTKPISMPLLLFECICGCAWACCSCCYRWRRRMRCWTRSRCGSLTYWHVMWWRRRANRSSRSCCHSAGRVSERACTIILWLLLLLFFVCLCARLACYVTFYKVHIYKVCPPLRVISLPPLPFLEEEEQEANHSCDATTVNDNEKCLRCWRHICKQWTHCKKVEKRTQQKLACTFQTSIISQFEHRRPRQACKTCSVMCCGRGKDTNVRFKVMKLTIGSKKRTNVALQNGIEENIQKCAKLYRIFMFVSFMLFSRITYWGKGKNAQKQLITHKNC